MRRFAAIAIVGLLFSPLSSHALVFADRCSSVVQWDILDLRGDGDVSPVTDLGCPPGYGPRVLRVKGDRLLMMARGMSMRNGTLLALYHENDARDGDADGIVMFRAHHGIRCRVPVSLIAP